MLAAPSLPPARQTVYHAGATLPARPNGWKLKSPVTGIQMLRTVNHSIRMRNHHAIKFDRVPLNIEDGLTFEQQITALAICEDLPDR